MQNIDTDTRTQLTPKDRQIDPQPADGLFQQGVGVLADMTAQRWRIGNTLSRFPNEEEEDPSKKACPTGGCPPENKKTNRDIYDDQMKQVAQKNNLDLNDPKQKRQAHMHVVDYMQPKVRENRKFAKQDREGPPVSEGPEFILKDGGIFFPEYGGSLQEMYENQKRVYPDKYDPKEHATMTLIEKTFVNGATVVSHASQYKDSQGNESIRDQIIMKWDPVNNKGEMIIYNIATDGNFHSVEGAFDVIRQRSPELTEIHPAEGVGIFVDKPLSPEEVSRVISSYDFDTRSIATDTIDTISYAGHRLKDDTNQVLEMTRDHLIAELEKKHIYLPPYLQRLLGFPKEHQDQYETQHLMILLEQRMDSFFQDIKIEKISAGKNNENMFILLRKHIEQSLNISPEQSEILLIQLQENWKATKDVAKAIELIQDVDIGSGGAIALMESMIRLQSESTTAEVLSKLTHRTIDGEIVNASEEQSGLAEDVVFVWFSSFMEKIKDEKPEEAITIVVKEEEKTLESMTTLWIVLLSLAQKVRPGGQVDMSIRAPKEQMSLEEEETVEHFQLAVVVWFLLKLTSYFEGLESFKSTLLEQRESIKKHVSKQTDSIVAQRGKQRIPEALMHPETTQWILLAIIWHLAMIREQGQVQITGNKQQVAIKRRTQINSSKNPTIFPEGVIFINKSINLFQN